MSRLGVLLAMGSLGCWQTPPLAISREGCDLYTNAEEPFSAALPEACADFRNALEIELGAQRPDLRPIAMSVWADSRDVLVDCPASSNACAIALHTSSVFPLDLHELVHAHLGTIAMSNAVFAEGIAVTYGCDQRIDPIVHTLPESWLANDEAFYGASDEGSYWAAAAFVSYLIDRFGAPRFFSFYRVARSDSVEVLDQRATETLGISLRTLLSTWASLDATTPSTLCHPILACAAPPLASPEALVLARGVNTVVPSRFRAGAIRTFEVRGPAPTSLTLEGLDPTVRVVSCDGTRGSWDRAAAGSRLDEELLLPRGRYAIWVEDGLPNDAAEITVSLRVE